MTSSLWMLTRTIILTTTRGWLSLSKSEGWLGMTTPCGMDLWWHQPMRRWGSMWGTIGTLFWSSIRHLQLTPGLKFACFLLVMVSLSAVGSSEGLHSLPILYIYQMLTIDLVTCKNKWCVIKEILPTLLIFCTWKNGEWPRNSILEFLSKWIFYALNPYCSLTKYLSRCAENVHGLRSLLQHSKLRSTGSLAPLRRPLDAVPIQLMALRTSLFPFRSDFLYMQPALSS